MRNCSRFQESTNKPLPRAGEKILSDYGHRSQISAGRYLQENPEKRGYDLLGDYLLGWLPVAHNGHLVADSA